MKRFLFWFCNLVLILGIGSIGVGAPVTQQLVGDQISCGNAVITGVSTMKSLYGEADSTTSHIWSTFRANGASSGYTVPTGYNFVARCVCTNSNSAWTSTARTDFVCGTTDVGLDSASGPSGASTVATLGYSSSEYTVGKRVCNEIFFQCAAAKTVNVAGNNSAGFAFYNLYGFEVKQ